MSKRLEMIGVCKRYRLPTDPRSLALVCLRRSVSRIDSVDAVADIDFSLGDGDVISLLGRNGAGKSTLLRLAAGVTAPTSGIVRRNGRVAAVLGIGVAFHPELSGLENVMLNGVVHGLLLSEVRDRLDSILDFAGLGDFIDAPVQTYSSGMTMRLGFSIAIHTNFDILVVDEALTVGDKEFQEKCLLRLKEFRRQGKALLLATHSIPYAREMGGESLIIEKGRCIRRGPADSVLAGG